MEIRLLHASEMKDAVGLADSIFRSDGRVSMGDSLPKVFSKSLLQSIGAFDNGRLVSFAGLVPSIVRIHESRLTVYSYGAVCTHPDYRGQGYARRMLRYVQEHARLSGASLLLVSGVLPIYIEGGCSPFGTAVSHRLTRENLRGLAENEGHGNLRFREAGEADWFGLHKLADGRRVRYEQSIWDLADLLEAQAVAALRGRRQFTFMAELDDVPVAFCTAAVSQVTGDGQEVVNPVIEWAGDERYLTALLSHMTACLPAEYLNMVVPWHEQGLLDRLRDAYTGTEKNQGTVHVLDAELLITQLGPYWKERGADSQLLDRLRHMTDHKQLVSLLFDTPEEKPGLLCDVLPVPFPYTKGLNFV